MANMLDCNDRIPITNFQIQKEGLLTFMDFCFLLNIMTTPRRFMDMAFHAFDVGADGAVGIEVSIITSYL